MDLVEAVRASVNSYDEVSRLSTSKLVRIFMQLDLSHEEQRSLIEATINEAEAVWLNSVARAEAKQQQTAQMASEALEEVANIKATMGEQAQAEQPAGSHATTKAALDKALALLASWREKKAQREKQVEAMQASNAMMTVQVYGPNSAPSTGLLDLSSATIEFLQMEGQRLRTERDKRWARMESELSRLKGLCAELGEVVSEAVSEAHPSLRSVEVGGQLESIDLTDATFGRMAAKLNSLQVVKADRELVLGQLRDVLTSLWDAVGISESAMERSRFAGLMSAPSRLHTVSLDEVRAEVRRLEECRAQAMRDLVVSKAKELQAVCAATHLPAPDITSLLADLNRRPADIEGAVPSTSGTGHVSEALAKVVRALSDVSAHAAHRQPVVEVAEELQMAVDESAWLRSYETDENRYKGRDANSKLQRSLRSAKRRAAIPSLITRLRDKLEAWHLSEGKPFKYDGRVYTDVLDEVQEEYEAQQAAALAAAQAAKTPAKNSSGGGVASVRQSVHLGRSVNLSAALNAQSSSVNLSRLISAALKPPAAGQQGSNSKHAAAAPRPRTSTGVAGRAGDPDAASASPLPAGTPGSDARAPASAGKRGTPQRGSNGGSDDLRRATADDQHAKLALPTPSRIPRFTVQ